MIDDEGSKSSCFICFEKCVENSNAQDYESRLKCKAKCECITQSEAFNRIFGETNHTTDTQ